MGAISDLLHSAGIHEVARQATERPSDFGWWGREEMFDTWGWAGIGYSQVDEDHDLLAVSNYKVISADLLERFPDDVEEVQTRHWCGGIQLYNLAVRVYVEGPETEEGDRPISDAFHACMEWHEQLGDYPVADEEHWSAMESEQFSEHVEQEVGYYLRAKLGDDGWQVDNYDADEVFQHVVEVVSQDAYRVDDLHHEAVGEAITEYLYHLDWCDAHERAGFGPCENQLTLET